MHGMKSSEGPGGRGNDQTAFSLPPTNRDFIHKAQKIIFNFSAGQYAGNNISAIS